MEIISDKNRRSLESCYTTEVTKWKDNIPLDFISVYQCTKY